MLAAAPYILVCFRVFYFKITLMTAVVYGFETRSLTVRAEHMLRERLRPEMGNVTMEWRRIHNEELNDTSSHGMLLG